MIYLMVRLEKVKRKMYNIEDSISTYKITYYMDKPIYIFDSHNMAFPAWGTVASRNEQAYQLVTFDHHTDTRSPFSCIKAKGEYDAEWVKTLHLKRGSFVFFDAFNLAVEKFVAYDEQIKTACKYGYLNKYYVICKDEQGCSIGNTSDSNEGYNAQYYTSDDLELFLTSHLEEILKQPLILDFDVDYFHSVQDLDKGFFVRIAPLIKAADAITIAREKWHFEDLREDKTLDHGAAVDMLLDGIRYALEEI